MEVTVPEERRRREEAELQAKARRQGTDPDADAEKQAAERKQQAADRRQRKADALTHNDEVGRLLLKGRGGKARKERSMVRYRVITQLLLDAYPGLAAGLRLVLPQLRKVEVKQLKSGEPREKVTYAGMKDAAEYLANRLAEADSPEEGNELIVDALVAAILADDEVLTQAERVGSWFYIDPETRKALAADVQAATRRKASKKK